MFQNARAGIPQDSAYGEVWTEPEVTGSRSSWAVLLSTRPSGRRGWRTVARDFCLRQQRPPVLVTESCVISVRLLIM